jgi:carnitine 3-dehydrogenase
MESSQEIQRVAVVGTGTIGASWSALFLANGLDVVATDPRPSAESDLRDYVAHAWPALVEMGLAEDASPERLHFAADVNKACEVADFVQENAPERKELKTELLARIDHIVRPDIIIASSSSALLITELQCACRHPERVILGHPFNPPHLMPLVELVGGQKTSSGALDRASAFYQSIGRTPIRLAKEVYGHVANRLQGAVFREAMHLLQSGVATLGDIDKAMTEGPGLRWALMGPFLTYHLAGGPGGMESFMKQFAPMQETLWKDLGRPSIDSSVQQLVINSMKQETKGRSIEALAASRDRRIVSLLTARRQTQRL